jgi:hypothetical protein
MKSLALLPLASLILASSALAQDDVLTLNVPIENLGTLHMASGAITPPIQLGQGMAALATPGIIYNNNTLPYAVAPCNTVFINAIGLGQARIDDGRIPTPHPRRPRTRARSTSTTSPRSRSATARPRTTRASAAPAPASRSCSGRTTTVAST